MFTAALFIITQSLETTQTSIGEWTDKENDTYIHTHVYVYIYAHTFLYTHNAILFSHEKERNSAIGNNMHGP